eukprot:UN11959
MTFTHGRLLLFFKFALFKSSTDTFGFLPTFLKFNK